MALDESTASRAVILTAIPPEYRAVRAHLSNPKEELHPRGTLYEVGVFGSTLAQWRVAIAEIGPSNDDAAAEAERAISHFDPAIILFVGVAGGLKDVRVGDVVSSTKIYGYESGKDERTFRPRPDVGESSYRLDQRSRMVIQHGRWIERISGSTPPQSPTARRGPLAAGEKVVAHVRSDTYQFLRQAYGDALAVEMEGRGFLSAVRKNAPVEGLVVRGISDMVSGKAQADQNGSQELASRHAAAFAFELLATLPPDRSQDPVKLGRPPTSQFPRPSRKIGKFLGDSRAELDHEMLKTAFIETPDFTALATTSDFQFVVGRRGTGKSALFHKLNQFFQGERDVLLIKSTPSEHDTLALESLVAMFSSNYTEARPVTRLLWRICLLLSVGAQVVEHYKVRRLKAHVTLTESLERYRVAPAAEIVERCVSVLKREVSARSAREALLQLADTVRVEDLQRIVVEAVQETGKRAVILLDGVDNGWLPTPVSTAILGGLAAAVSDLAEKTGDDIRALVFIRDNMFRALAHFDSDHSRHIQANTLRLRWDEQSLFHMVAQRIRVGLGRLDIENDAKAWNLFAQRDIKDRLGFAKCLQNTLYRPRDVIALLNDAYVTAIRGGREVIFGDDIEVASTNVSDERLSDFLKEYEVVLPGIRGFVDAFDGVQAIRPYGEVVQYLDEVVSREDFFSKESRDFAIFGSGIEVFRALYGVGFLGLQDPRGVTFHFCHDGALTVLGQDRPATLVAVHPSYWRSLHLRGDTPPHEMVVEIYDDDTRSVAEVKDLRIKRLGQIVEELPKMRHAESDAQTFFDWCVRALRLLFAGDLAHFETLRSESVDSVDIIASNVAREGFWAYVRDAFNARKILFVVLAQPELDESVLNRVRFHREALADVGFVCVLYSSQSEAIDDDARALIRSANNEFQCLLFPMPLTILARCMAKQRSGSREDYTRRQLTKRLKTVQGFIRGGSSR